MPRNDLVLASVPHPAEIEARDGARLPLHSVEVEMSVLGAALIDERAAAEVVARCQPEHFHEPAHRRLLSALRSLLEGTPPRPVEPVTLSEALRDAGDFEAVGGAAYLAALWDYTPSAAALEHHLSRLFDLATRRAVERAGREIVGLAHHEAGSAAALVDRAGARVLELGATHDRREAASAREVLREVYVRLEARNRDGRSVTGVPSGLSDLDEKTAGFQPGDLVIVAGRPSQGKTAFALGIAAHAAIRERKPVAIFSLEMGSPSLIERVLCSEGRIDGTRMRTGQLHDDEFARLATVTGYLNPAPLYLDDSAGLTVLELRSRARRLKSQHPDLAMVVVDYLQLMTGDGENRTQVVSEISRGLKALAKELNVPVLALSQLSRAVENRPDKRPLMSDLRECLPIDEWVYTPDGPVQMGHRPTEVISACASGVETRPAEYIEKRYNRVYRVRTQYGTFRATARHRVLTGTGWKQVRDLVSGRDVIAAPTRIPHASRGALPHARLLGWLLGNGHLSGTPALDYREELDGDVREAVAAFGVQVRPRSRQDSPGLVQAYLSCGVESGCLPNPLMEWIRSLGLEGKGAYEKAIPACYLGTSDDTHAELLRGLWETDGTVTGGRAKYTTVSEVLARQVAWLLLTLGIRSTVNQYDGLWEVCVSRADHERMRPIVDLPDRFGELASPDPCRVDPAPGIFVELAAEIYRGPRRLQRTPDGRYKAICKSDMAAIVEEEPALSTIARSPYMTAPDLGWARLYEVERLEDEVRVADLHVPGPHNFVAAGLVVHNSGQLEQDADLILFLFRPEYYFGSVDKEGNNIEGVAEVIIGKQRNGATGTVTLRFLKEFTKFESFSNRREP